MGFTTTMSRALKSLYCPVVRAGATYFALVFVAGFALGLIRVPFLVPRFGERVAELLETPVMLLVIYFASRYVVRRLASTTSARFAVAIGVFALALQGRSIAGYISERDPVSGSVYLASVLLYAVMPWLQTRRIRISTGSDV